MSLATINSHWLPRDRSRDWSQCSLPAVRRAHSHAGWGRLLGQEQDAVSQWHEHREDGTDGQLFSRAPGGMRRRPTLLIGAQGAWCEHLKLTDCRGFVLVSNRRSLCLFLCRRILNSSPQAFSFRDSRKDHARAAGGLKAEGIWVSTLLPQQIPVSLGPCFLANCLSKYLLAMNERSVSPDSPKALSPIYPWRPLPFQSDQLAGSYMGAETQGCFLLCAQILNDLPEKAEAP